MSTVHTNELKSIDGTFAVDVKDLATADTITESDGYTTYRWEGGTQIQFKRGADAVITTNAAGNVFYVDATVALPTEPEHTFIGSPLYIPLAEAGVDDSKGKGTWTGSYRVVGGNLRFGVLGWAVDCTAYPYYYAIGRWK